MRMAPQHCAACGHDGDALAAELAELKERFEACFQSKEHAEHHWGIAEARIAALKEFVRPLARNPCACGFISPCLSCKASAALGASLETESQ